jgi:hypothetical protein
MPAAERNEKWRRFLVNFATKTKREMNEQRVNDVQTATCWDQLHKEVRGDTTPESIFILVDSTTRELCCQPCKKTISSIR